MDSAACVDAGAWRICRNKDFSGEANAIIAQCFLCPCILTGLGRGPSVVVVGMMVRHLAYTLDVALSLHVVLRCTRVEVHVPTG